MQCIFICICICIYYPIYMPVIHIPITPSSTSIHTQQVHEVKKKSQSLKKAYFKVAITLCSFFSLQQFVRCHFAKVIMPGGLSLL